MNYLEWNLDPEDEADLDDPMGYIKIVGDEGIIIEDYTNLDNFFEAFVEGIERIKTEDVVRADIIVEPNDLIFSCKNNFLRIEYGSQKTIILNKYQFIEEVKTAVAKLIELLDELADRAKQERRELFKLRSFL